MPHEIALYNLRHTSERVTKQLLTELEVYNLYLASGHCGDRIIVVQLQSELPDQWSRRMKEKYGEDLKFTRLKEQIEQ